MAGDIRFRGLERTNNEPQVYLAAAQQRDSQIGFYAPQDLIIRSSVPPATLMPAVRAIVARADPADLTVFAAAVVLSLIMTIAGSLMPAWRAVRVDPLTATRAD